MITLNLIPIHPALIKVNMETRNQHGYPIFICDWCEKPIVSSESMTVEGTAENKTLNMVYHTGCYGELVRKFPNLHKDDEVKVLD